jgi:hypothetical protein
MDVDSITAWISLWSCDTLCQQLCSALNDAFDLTRFGKSDGSDAAHACDHGFLGNRGVGSL